MIPLGRSALFRGEGFILGVGFRKGLLRYGTSNFVSRWGSRWGSWKFLWSETH